jgi:CBS domain-containing membrane protein
VEISHADVVSALESFDSFVDITEDDLVRLHQLLSRRVTGKEEKARD